MSNSGKGGAGILVILGMLVILLGAAGFLYLQWDELFPPKVGHLKLPYILWGGDVATFHANGGTKTTPDSLFGKAGFDFELVDGNDFDKQVEQYLKNETPFLRGTFSQLAQNCDKLGIDSKARPVVFLQMTWSAGDHVVSRAGLKTLADVKGKRIALQKNGPHVGMLDDILRTARLEWKDIQPVWTDAVTGDQGPEALFRKDKSVDACFAITPDMLKLTGDLEKTGDGQNGTVEGAHVLVSTADMKRSIADVYACRKDFYDKNKDTVEKFVAAYLKGCEELLAHRRDPNGKPYKDVLKMTLDIFGKEAVPSEADADGLIADAVFVGLPGNRSFFTDAGNLSGFDFKQKFLLDFAVKEGYARQSIPFNKPNLDYNRIEKLGNLTVKEVPKERFRPNPQLLPQNTIYSFVVYFEPNQHVFPEEKYGQDFERALYQASLFGNAVMSIRGHGDPSWIVHCLEKSGTKQGVIRKQGGKYKLKDGSPFDMNDIKQIFDVVRANDNVYFIDPETNQETPQAVSGQIDYLQGLSERRADSVRNSVLSFAGSRNWRIDPSQIQAKGMGGTEPVVVVPVQDDDPRKNMRVEFRIVRISQADRIASESDIDY